MTEVLMGNYDPGSRISDPAGHPPTAPALSDQDMDFQYHAESQPGGARSEYSDQDINGPPLYDTCELWQDELALSGSMPEFGGQGYNRSPFTMSDDFIRFLFEGNISSDEPRMSGTTGINGQSVVSLCCVYLLFMEANIIYSHTPDMQYQYKPDGNANKPKDSNLPEKNSSIDLPMVQHSSSMMISESKTQEIIGLVTNRFSETDPKVSTDTESAIRDRGCKNFNLMSREMMQAYINNFWRNFHPQLPICELVISFSAWTQPGFYNLELTSCSAQTDILA